MLVALLCAIAAVAQAAPSCGLPAFPNPALLHALQRGVNLTGWDAADPALRPTRRQLQSLRAQGFTHIRLPLDPARLRGEAAPDYRAGIGAQMKRLVGLGYAVSLDLHGGGEIGARVREDPQAGFEDLARLWSSLVPLVRRFDPSQVAIELLNEPDIGQDAWMDMAGRLTRRLRAELPLHTVIVGPSGPQRHETLGGMQPLTDRNTVYAVHYYDPFVFTHQGMTWGAVDDPLRLLEGLPFPTLRNDPAVTAVMTDLRRKGRSDAADALASALETPWDAAMVEAAFDTMARWSRTHDRPVIVNEFGVLTFTAPRAARLTWLETVSASARARCIGWTHWDFQEGFGLIDPKTRLPDTGVMRALDMAAP